MKRYFIFSLCLAIVFCLATACAPEENGTTEFTALYTHRTTVEDNSLHFPTPVGTYTAETKNFEKLREFYYDYFIWLDGASFLFPMTEDGIAAFCFAQLAAENTVDTNKGVTKGNMDEMMLHFFRKKLDEYNNAYLQTDVTTKLITATGWDFSTTPAMILQSLTVNKDGASVGIFKLVFLDTSLSEKEQKDARVALLKNNYSAYPGQVKTAQVNFTEHFDEMIPYLVFHNITVEA